MGGKLKTLFIAVCIVTMATTAIAADVCYEKANTALLGLKTWSDLRSWFENYSACDDGYYAEGISDFVVKSLAKQWATLPFLQKEIAKNSKFKSFVLNHIDHTTDANDLRAVLGNAENNCPSDQQSLCKAIETNAETALKEIKDLQRKIE
jgi:hypothetical protein